MLAESECMRNDVPQRLISTHKSVTNGHQRCAAAGEGQPTIRIAQPDEAPAIVELTNAIFREKTSPSLASFTNARDVEQLMHQGTFLLAEKEKEIVGYAYLKPRLEASRLELLAVAPMLQRAGIGSQLLQAAERLSSSMHCLFMHLSVMNLHLETLRFCRRRGYIEFGIESLNINQPVSLNCHLVRMCKRLHEDCVAF